MKAVPSHIPDLPGVYFFKDEHDVILYIGKAKSLKKRIQSHFRNYKTDWKIKDLIDHYHAIDFVITHTEIEALLLEASLIQKHKPKFNALLKEGNPFVYIFFSNHALPEIKLVRHKKEKGTFFGPFVQKQHARKVLRFLMQTFQLYRCNKTIPHGCLDFHMGYCAGTCRSDFNEQDYRFRIELAKKALAQNRDAFVVMINNQMRDYSQAMAYEKAQRLHNYLQNIHSIFATLASGFSEKKYAEQILHATAKKEYQTQIPQNSPQLMQDLIGSDRPIHTIDCFDISHFQSKEIVGSCVRFVDGMPDKNQFRRFKIKTLTIQNDYQALQEIIERRYKNQKDIPDLIVIDGGKGQLSAAAKKMPNALLVSLAKKEERLFGPSYIDGKVLDMHDPAARILIALRDYAHHFAISYHRLLRRKNIQKS